LQRYDEAAADYRSAIRMNNQVSARLNLANIYLVNLKEFSNAVKEYDAVMAINPTYPHIQTYKGMALFQAGQYKEAIAALSTAIETDPGDAQAYGYRALSYEKAGDSQNASKDAAVAKRSGFAFDEGSFR